MPATKQLTLNFLINSKWENSMNEPEETLRGIFRTMDAHRAQEIREAYYKAVEGLSALAESLEIADAEMGSPNDHALIEEHLIAG